jgi:phospholipase/carboxylesterase
MSITVGRDLALERNHSTPGARDARGLRPPILLAHGDQDPLIPAAAMFAAMNDLAEAEIPCQWHLSFGVGHGIDAGGLRHGGLFLAKAFGLRAR